MIQYVYVGTEWRAAMFVRSGVVLTDELVTDVITWGFNKVYKCVV